VGSNIKKYNKRGENEPQGGQTSSKNLKSYPGKVVGKLGKGKPGTASSWGWGRRGLNNDITALMGEVKKKKKEIL